MGVTLISEFTRPMDRFRLSILSIVGPLLNATIGHFEFLTTLEIIVPALLKHRARLDDF